MTMMRKMTAVILIAAWPQVSAAGLEVCNATKVEQSIAIGYKANDIWISEGWWNAAAGACVQPVGGDLANRYYYLLALADGYEFQADDYSFCVIQQEFTIEGDSECVARGYIKGYFIEVDTGETATHFTKAITAKMSVAIAAPDSGSLRPKTPDGKAVGKSQSNVASDVLPEADTEAVPDASRIAFSGGPILSGLAPTEGAEAFSKIGHFQACETQDEQYACSFHVEGWKFYAYGDGLTPRAMLSALAGLEAGTPVRLTGDILYYGDITTEIVARAVEPVPGSDPHGAMRANMQGDWVSLDDPAAKMRVTGMESAESYGDMPLALQFLQLADSCDASGGSGPVLIQTNPEDQEPQCYLVARADGTRLELIYLARGNTLRYQRP